MERIKAVYKITIGQYYYIGSSINYSRRKAAHLQKLRKNNHPNPILQNLHNKGYELIFSTLYISNDIDENIQNVEQNFLNDHFEDIHCVNISKIVGGGAISPDPAKSAKKTVETKRKNGYWDNPITISDQGKINMSISAKNRVDKNKDLYSDRIKAGQLKRWDTHDKNFILIHEDGREFGPYRFLVGPENDKVLSRKSARELYTNKKSKISGFVMKILH